MGIEEGTFWDEHWVLYGNQFDNKFHILKKKKKTNFKLTSTSLCTETILRKLFSKLEISYTLEQTNKDK